MGNSLLRLKNFILLPLELQAQILALANIYPSKEHYKLSQDVRKLKALSKPISQHEIYLWSQKSNDIIYYSNESYEFITLYPLSSKVQHSSSYHWDRELEHVDKRICVTRGECGRHKQILCNRSVMERILEARAGIVNPMLVEKCHQGFKYHPCYSHIS